jgi:hypothetical protein
MTESEMRELCTLWQKRLRLQDWNVRLQVKSMEDVEGGFARARIWQSEKSALVQIVDPADTNSLDVQVSGGRDLEEDIVHELLHLPCDAFVPEDQDTPEYEAIEQMIGVLANCIVRLSREE